jgi:Family of unknown function (DUF6152)
MNARLILFCTIAASLSAIASETVRAHHSLAAEFDVTRMVTLTGTITEMKWTNPHSWLQIDVKDDKGEVQNWAIEFGSPNGLYRRGWRRDDLPAKATVTVVGYPNRDGSRSISATDVKLPDGRTLFAGNAPESQR